MKNSILLFIALLPLTLIHGQINNTYSLLWYEDFQCEPFGATVAGSPCSSDGPGAATLGHWGTAGPIQVEPNELATTASSQLGVFQTATFNVSAIDEIAFRTEYFSLFLTTGSFVDIFVDINGQGFTRIPNFQGMGNSSHTLTFGFVDDEIDITGLVNANTISIRVEMFCNNCSSHNLRLKDITIFGRDLCPEVLNINDNPIASAFYQADTIYSSGTVQSGSDIIFRAGAHNLENGFEVSSGATFETINDPCPN